jgi:hypothetical protein
MSLLVRMHVYAKWRMRYVGLGIAVAWLLCPRTAIASWSNVGVVDYSGSAHASGCWWSGCNDSYPCPPYYCSPYERDYAVTPNSAGNEAEFGKCCLACIIHEERE